MKCKHYCASCFLIHHCRGFYDVCPYGRPEESSAEKSLIDEYHGFTDMTLSEKHDFDDLALFEKPSALSEK